MVQEQWARQLPDSHVDNHLAYADIPLPPPSPSNRILAEVPTETVRVHPFACLSTNRFDPPSGRSVVENSSIKHEHSDDRNHSAGQFGQENTVDCVVDDFAATR